MRIIPGFCFMFAVILVFISACSKTPAVVEPPKPVETRPSGQASLFPAKLGSLVIISEPAGASVKIDDKPMGTTPLALKDVPATSYRIEMEVEHYDVYRGEVVVKPQQMAEVREKLKPKPGALEVKSEPAGAKVKLDGSDAGVTPFSKWVTPGQEHTIVFSMEGFYPEERKATVQPEGKEAISVDLRPIPRGTLEVRSDPEGAKVWVDGRNVGMTPYNGTVIAGEEHNVIVSAEGYQFEGKKAIVHPDKKETVSFTLKKQEEMPSSIIGNDGVVMMLIPAGDFLMGSPEGEGAGDEHPQHTVFLDAFYMDKYEVTNAQYKQFMDATGHSAPGYWNDEGYNQPNQPVVGVSWHDAVAYAEWVGKRLPTEAEWEKAARGGLVGKEYPWGDSITHDDANCDGTGGKDKWHAPAPVGSFAPNGYGLYDMAGNVWEWCADWYDSGYYAKSPERNPTGSDSGSSRVLRGGSWDYYSYGLRVALRSDFVPTYGLNSVGFRGVAQD